MDNTSAFLPTNYEVPEKPGNYMKFKDGENRIRILQSPVVGWLSWKTLSDGTRKPIRKHLDEAFMSSEIDDEDAIKHFWAMPVWNYADERVQILEITQKGIQKTVKALAKDSDWGSPIGYDLIITREGKDLLTKYQVQPKPAKALDIAIEKAFKETDIDLNALYKGEDPFKKS